MFSGLKKPASITPTLHNQAYSVGQSRPGSSAAAAAAGPPAPPIPEYGSQSGPTYVEDRYTQRASGTDPGWEYGMGRASDAINRQFAARGGYNSSGATQQLSDMYANSVAQREGQLDNLSAAASGAHQHALDSMFTQGQRIANGQAGVAGAYDQSAGGAMSDAYKAQIELMLNKAGVDQKTRQAQLGLGTDLFKTGASIAGYGTGKG